MNKYMVLVAIAVYALLIDVVILAVWWHRKRRKAAVGRLAGAQDRPGAV